MGAGGYGLRASGETPVALEESLRRIAEAGFTHADLGGTLAEWDLIAAGRVNAGQLARLVQVVDRLRDRLRFTLHGPPCWQANLFDLANAERCERIWRAGMEVAAALQAEVITYEVGLRLPWPKGSLAPMTDLLAREREIVRSLADEAATWGCRIAMETWTPAPKFGYSYACWPERLVAQVEAIARPNVGICLDTGHTFVSAHWLGYDYLQAVRTMAPHVGFFHLEDTAGGGVSDENLNLLMVGVDDHHLPPGFGDVPFEAMFAGIDFPHDPVMYVEIGRPRYLPLIGQLRERLGRWAALR